MLRTEGSFVPDLSLEEEEEGLAAAKRRDTEKHPKAPALSEEPGPPEKKCTLSPRQPVPKRATITPNQLSREGAQFE